MTGKLGFSVIKDRASFVQKSEDGSKRGFLILALLSAISTCAGAAGDVQELSVQLGSTEIIFTPPQKLVFVTNASTGKQCSLSTPGFDFFLSHDRNTVIFGKNRYIPFEDILGCDHKSPLLLKRIPVSSTLTDMNLEKNLYVAVNAVATAPQLLCVATVGRLGSTKNLVNLPGADIPGASEEQKLETAFECPERSLISSDGRYVSITPEVDCSDSSYPGVWDIHGNTKVVFPAQDFSEQEASEKCRALFF